MIVFSYPDEGNLDALLSHCDGSEEYEHVHAYLLDVMEAGDEDDIAVCFCFGTLLTRRFFGEGYEFSYPMALFPEADIDGALSELEEYCRRHELPLVYCDLVREECDALCERYRFCREESFDISEDGEETQLIYRLCVENECTLLDAIPTLSDGTLVLGELSEEDVPSYARLCRDEEILAVWGYDYRDVDPDLGDRDFYRMAMEEFESGVSIPFAIRVGERFVGEAVLYAFDGKGGAEFSIRILSGYRRCGYAERALAILFDFCEDTLALRHVDGICLKENAPSRAMMAKMMDLVGEREGNTVLYRKVFG